MQRLQLYQPGEGSFFIHPDSIVFIQSPASVHSMLPTPRRYLGTHSHFVAPHPLTITEALPFLPFVFPSSLCPTLINLPPSPRSPPHTHTHPPTPNAVWWQTSADQEFIFSSSTYYQFLSISPPLSPPWSSDLSVSHQQFQNRWLHFALGKNNGFGLRRYEGQSSRSR